MVVVLSTWESSRGGCGRVAVRLESTSHWCTYQRHCGNAGTSVTGGRTSGIVECWAPRYWTYQRHCEMLGPRVRHKSGWYFLTLLVPPEQVSLELYMVSACLVLRPAWLDFDFAVSEVVATIALFSFTPSPFLPSSLLFLCSLTAAHRFGRIFHFGIFGSINRGRQHGPVFDVDYLDHDPPRKRATALG